MSKVEIRAVGDVSFTLDNGRPRIDARAIVYDSWSVDLGGFVERMAPGSVTLDNDLVALFDHDSSMVLGRVSAGTMSVSQDERGVSFTAFPPDTSWARDLRASMERGDIKGCSFRMIVDRDNWTVGDNGQVRRDVMSARVSELTITSMPAYPATTAEARSHAVEVAADAIKNLEAVVSRSTPEKVTDMTEKRDMLAGQAPTVADVVDQLTDTFCDVFSFYLRAHGAHWNVVGPDFAEYHKLFNDIYDDVYDSVDPLAENLRKLGAPAPFQLTQIIAERDLQDAQVSFDAASLAADLLQANDYVLDELSDLFDVATAVGLQGLANYAAERLDKHAFWKWQLSASLGVQVSNPIPDPLVDGIDPDDVAEEDSEPDMNGAFVTPTRSSVGATGTNRRSSYVAGFGFIPNRKEK